MNKQRRETSVPLLWRWTFCMARNADFHAKRTEAPDMSLTAPIILDFRVEPTQKNTSALSYIEDKKTWSMGGLGFFLGSICSPPSVAIHLGSFLWKTAIFLTE